jgi:D-alanyl-D-alanine carboxypeptidase
MRTIREGGRVRPRSARRRRPLAAGLVLLLLLAGATVAVEAGLGPAAPGERAGAAPPATTPPVPATSSPAGPATSSPAFDRSRFSIDQAGSPWVVVDKLRPLDPLDHAPADLVDVGGGHQMRAEAAAALGRMFGDAAAVGLRLTVDSAYRSYAYQQRTFASAVARLGEAQALRASARPGYSEHQTGLTADIGGGGCQIEQCFAGTPEGRWVAENAYRYGFVIRYPDGAEAVTGYQYEPWHVRYVGAELATEMRSEGMATLEQFFGLPPAPGYAG